MAIDFSGVVFAVLNNLSVYVFGNMPLTCISMVLFLTLIAILIQIPLPYAIAMQLPMIVVLTAYGFMTILTGGIFAGIYLIIAVSSFYAGMGMNQ